MEAYERFADPLFRHAYFRVSSRDTALDLVQDTFTKTWDFMVRGGVVEDYRSFLYRTLNNLIIDEYRRRKEESLDQKLAEEGVDEGAFRDLVADTRPEVERSHDAQLVRAHIAALPPVYRDVVIMRYVDEFSPQEIAAITGLSANVVSVRIHRGTKLLRAQMETKGLYGNAAAALGRDAKKP